MRSRGRRRFDATRPRRGARRRGRRPRPTDRNERQVAGGRAGGPRPGDRLRRGRAGRRGGGGGGGPPRGRRRRAADLRRDGRVRPRVRPPPARDVVTVYAGTPPAASFGQGALRRFLDDAVEPLLEFSLPWPPASDNRTWRSLRRGAQRRQVYLAPEVVSYREQVALILLEQR